MKSSVKSALASLAFATLCACGGGNSGGAPAASEQPITSNSIVINAAPIANAGVDQSVVLGSVVSLDAGASSDANGDALSYRWRLTSLPSGSAAVISNTAAARPIFTPDAEGIFTASLTVNDGKADSASDLISITVSKKATAITVPVANAGQNLNVLVGTTVTLNGTASSALNGNPLTYRWMFLSKPLGNASLINPTSSQPTFIVDAVGTYTVALVVNNIVTDSAPANVVVTAAAATSLANVPPIANAGADQYITTGATVSLDGSLSKDLNGDRLTYAWTFISKPQASSASISIPTSVSPNFRADVAGTYDVKLTVNDGKADSISGDVISVVALSPSVTTIADTGTYRCASISKEQALALYAQGHTYLDRDHDGKPCESNDILNELASPYVAPATSSNGQCYVNGYYRKNGTYVHGYYRSCRT